MKKWLACLLISTSLITSAQSNMTNHGGSSLVLFIGDVTVHCDADFTSVAAGNLEFKGTGSPELQVDGDYTINSGSTFTVGISEIEMTGSSAQLFDSGTKSHYNVTVNNSSGDVTLSGNDLTVTNTLLFTAGHVINSTLDLNIPTGATISGATSAAFVVPASTGVLKIDDIGGVGANTGSIEFPVGYSPIATAYSPIYFDNDPGTVGNFSVRMDDDVLDGGTSGSAITTYVVDRTWHVITTSGAPSVIVKAKWHSSQEIGGFNRTQGYFSRWVSGTTWNQASASVTAVDEGGGFYSHSTTNRHTTITKPWAIASNNILPVELLEFNVSKENEQSKIEWITASEIDNDYFVVEKSQDGLEFSEIDMTDGAGNSNINIAYLEYDETPFNGINYYRLKQVNFDGSFVYSDTRTLIYDSEENNNSILIYPNPTRDFNNLQFISNNGGTYHLEILNELGQVVYTSTINSISGKNTIPLNLSNHASGNYYIKLINPLGYSSIVPFNKVN